VNCPAGPAPATQYSNDATGAVEVYSTKDRKGKTVPINQAGRVSIWAKYSK